MTRPDARAELESLLDEMLALYPALMRGGPQQVRDGWGRVAHIAHGWYQRCHRGVEALRLLAASGYTEEASPLRRSIIEHAVALRWLAAEGEGIGDTVALRHGEDVKYIRDRVEAAGWCSVDLKQMDEVIASVRADIRDDSKNYLMNFTQRAEEYGEGHELLAWLGECARSHATFESAVCYFDPADGALLEESRKALWETPFAAGFLLEALLAFRQIFNPEPWEDEVARLLAWYREVTLRVQDGLPSE